MSSALYPPDLTGAPSADRAPAGRVLVDGDRRQDLRWRPGDRLEQLFEQQCAAGVPDRPCVEAGDTTLTYRELDARANRLARHLLARRIGSGHRVALLFDDPVHSYVAMLAVLKAGAAYVPLDAGFPTDRIAYIVADAEVSAVLTLAPLRRQLTLVRALVVSVDDMADRIAAEPAGPITAAERGRSVDELAYIIYTSGSTGRPKGVAVEHPSIVNFIRVAAEVYGIRQQDRVYQGLTIAFDFSFEEIWVSWAVGATLVPKPGGASLLGVELHTFLAERRVTALCCVPTLLATLEEDLPGLRFLLVSGEACPQDLITRWYRADRRFLNVYGPTEATVTATWTTVHPDRPVTIGQPLPTYTTVVLDQQDPTRALPHGEVGELGIAGIGLAAGYLNRDDLTAKAFVPDFLALPNNPSGRIYRTGDLCRVNADGEIEYLGRIDMQVKIRGYRIELTEIESVLLQVPGIAAVVVDTFEPVEGQRELVGYYSLRTGAVPPTQDAITEHLREQLPSYMVPSYLEHLDRIPMTTSDKADRKALPAPRARRAGGATGPQVPPGSATERLLADALARTLGLDTVSVDSHFFDDLGANSLLMARFAALVRAETSVRSLSMRELYGHPTVRTLAALVGDVTAAAGPVATGTVVRTSTAGYWMVGTLQLLSFLGATYLGALLLETGLVWSFAAPTALEVAGRSAAFGLATFVAACLLPILAKWLLVGRFRPREIRLWSLGHFRFWLVKTLIRANPLAMFVGSPVYNLYLRALGARVGRGVTILSGPVPAAPDLISIGAGTVIRRDSSFAGYRAVAGRIQLGRVTIGRDVFIGEKSTLDINSTMGDGAQLGHMSSVPAGGTIPAGESWHGVPAEPTTVDYRVVPPARCGQWRRFGYGSAQLFGALVLAPVLGAVTIGLLGSAPARPAVQGVVDSGHDLLLNPAFYAATAGITLALFVFGILTGLSTMILAPRLLQRLVRPGQVYKLYGIRWMAAQAITGLGNSSFFMSLFGDSSAVVHYLQAIGYRMPKLEQTGSNFGTELKQDAPLLTTIGSGTMISDSLTIMNADFSSTSFRMSRIELGARNFMGNNIAYPADAKIGENVLLGTMVGVPIEGPVRENVGLLGSPCFEIPRTVARDTEFDHLKDPAVLRRLLWRKNRHNAVSMALFLAVRWVQVFVGTVLMVAAADLHYLLGEFGIAAAGIAALLFGILFGALVEKAVLGFRPLQPRFVSIYDPYFWRHERLWKLGAGALFNGTPFKNVLWRLLGVRIGRRVFDDGCAIPEKTLVTLGDDVVLNAGSVIQCHSLEDGTFKSDRTAIGSGAVIGVESFVHYGVTIGEGSELDGHAFLMKGETVAPFATWLGNPATEVRAEPVPETRSTPEPVPETRSTPTIESVPTGPVEVVVDLPTGSIPRQSVPRVPAARAGADRPGQVPLVSRQRPGPVRNALPQNGRPQNGRPRNGRPQNGQAPIPRAADGQRPNGPRTNGHASTGRPATGRQPNGQQPNGQVPAGPARRDLSPRDRMPDRRPADNQPSEALPTTTRIPMSRMPKARTVNGTEPNKKEPNGNAPNGKAAHERAEAGAIDRPSNEGTSGRPAPHHPAPSCQRLTGPLRGWTASVPVIKGLPPYGPVPVGSAPASAPVIPAQPQSDRARDHRPANPHQPTLPIARHPRRDGPARSSVDDTQPLARVPVPDSTPTVQFPRVR